MQVLYLNPFAPTNIETEFLRALDDSLKKLFGQKAKTQIYDYLETKFMLKSSEILAKPEVFSKGIFTLFGSASKLVELNIVKNFYGRVGAKFEPGENFSHYVRALTVVQCVHDFS